MAKLDLLTHLRHWGLKVVEKPGWRDRGRPYDFTPEAVFAHHTASPSTSGNFASENVVTFGRSDLPGPLSQFLLGRDGTVMIIAAGYANHAGFGGPKAGIPENRGNTFAYGIEAENNGLGERWSKEQLNSYYRLCAALLDYMGTKNVLKVLGHKEWTTRKIDPAGITMEEFRRQVAIALAHGPTVVTVHLSRLKPGKNNKDILRVKRRLARKGFFHGADTGYFGKGLENAWTRWEEHLNFGNPDHLPGRKGLERLGFRVEP